MESIWTEDWDVTLIPIFCPNVFKASEQRATVDSGHRMAEQSSDLFTKLAELSPKPSCTLA